ncbi:signal transduction histidine kinase, putative [Babesia ovis]|uniref:Signal transduction histidine kinase, putative n=1 Tax=Babesia ovis TaxID=5869 RepID=A0A9W5WUY1_BABOV|nr:signal transduction histidine kinase, putative [Babesia ovis]
MSANISYTDDHTHTCFESDAYFDPVGNGSDTRSSTIQSSLTPVHTQSISQEADTVTQSSSISSGERCGEGLSIGFDENMIKRKSMLLNVIGRFKAKYPEAMTLPEYMMHAYVILHTKNEKTILTYEIITSHTKTDPSLLSNILRSQTLSRLEQEEFDIDAAGIFNADFENDKELASMDKQFTWLCGCCCQVIDETEEKVMDQHVEKRKRDVMEDNEDEVQMDTNEQLKQYDEEKKTNSFSFSKLVPVEDLPNDVMYEALRQHGNRLIQRSLFAAPRRLYGSPGWSCNQEVAARLNSSAAELKEFADDIQRYSVDNTPNEEYYGEERRLSVRQSALLRKRYL